MKTRLVFALAVGLLLAADVKDDKKKDLDQLKGTWTAATLEYNGENMIGGLIKELKVVIDGDTLIVKGEDEEVKKYGKATLKLDPTTTPKVIDITIASGDEKGMKFEGIYELGKDEWKLCVKPFGKERPAKFESKADSGDVLIVFKRDK
ncbi:MAG TPA: TIGR03067 domain-containing protein [Gemmataceae bacterium]|nr:TIGR03067 domain-containing protein [Gemmataceae bacterium]